MGSIAQIDRRSLLTSLRHILIGGLAKEWWAILTFLTSVCWEDEVVRLDAGEAITLVTA
jgi:hypothetical protein